MKTSPGIDKFRGVWCAGDGGRRKKKEQGGETKVEVSGGVDAGVGGVERPCRDRGAWEKEENGQIQSGKEAAPLCQ